MSAQQPSEEKLVSEVTTLIDGERMLGFSDAVFAFAATLLVLKIDLPQIPPELLATEFTNELLKLWPAYAANLISFLIIAYYWRGHHKLFLLIKRYDNTVVWLNILLLIFVSFLPFPIDLFGEYSSIVPVTVFYTASLAVVGFLLLAIWLYAAQGRRLLSSHMKPKMITYITLNQVIAPLVFTLSIPLAFIDHMLAKGSWLLVIVLLIMLDRRYHFSDQERLRENPDLV